MRPHLSQTDRTKHATPEPTPDLVARIIAAVLVFAYAMAADAVLSRYPELTPVVLGVTTVVFVALLAYVVVDAATRPMDDQEHQAGRPTSADHADFRNYR